MKIRLTETEEVVLRAILFKSTNDLAVDINAGVANLEEGLADHLRNLCSENLQKMGFDENYEPTETGNALESLIDKLFIG